MWIFFLPVREKARPLNVDLRASAAAVAFETKLEVGMGFEPCLAALELLWP